MPIFRQKSHFNRPTKSLSDNDDDSENDDIAQIEVIPDHLVREKKESGFNFNPMRKMRKQQAPGDLHKITFPRTNLKTTYNKSDVRMINLEQKGPCAYYGRSRSPKKLIGRPLVMADEEAVVYDETNHNMTNEQRTFKEIREQQYRKFELENVAMEENDKFAAFNEIIKEFREKAGIRYGWPGEDMNEDVLSKHVQNYKEKKQRKQAQLSQGSHFDEVEDTPPRYEEAVEMPALDAEPPVVFQRPSEGSYPNMTPSEEKNMQQILRLSWKGDKEGLVKYLENERRWGKINLQIDSKGRSALHLASSFGDEALMNILLRVPGIDPNLRDSNGMTPLFKAAQVNSPRCIARLLESGSNPLICCNDGCNVLQYLIMEHGDEYLHSIQTLLNNQELRANPLASTATEEFDRFTFLHYACSAERGIKVGNTVEMLINNGIDLDARDGKGRTPLTLATQNNRKKLVRMLIRSGADPDIRDKDNKKALHYAEPDTKLYMLLASRTTMEDNFTPESSESSHSNNYQHREEELTSPTDVHTTSSQRPRRLPRLSEHDNVETPSQNFRPLENNRKQPSQKEICTNTSGGVCRSNS
ncbi:ankycorbin-like [Clytia hemisphaerica]|uniref:Uncharacterized protein n=1 Tax=Clytia hemisphaerica TaxID=252671 RepID=A0A7M5VBR7_9CNID|eukprot:TCONS_00026104-protein